MTAERRVGEKIAAEAEAIDEQIARLDDRLPDAQTEYDQAWDAWTAAGGKREIPVAVDTRAENASRTLHGIYDAARGLRAKRARVTSPEERERRLQATGRLDTLRQTRPAGPSRPPRDDAAQQATLERMRDMRQSGMGVTAIAKTLNEEGVPTFSGRGQWHSGVVHRALRTEVAS